MKIIDLHNDKFETGNNNFIALGNFDGVHIAHVSILKNLVEQSKFRGLQSSILIFKEHTKNSLEGKNSYLLTSLNQKLQILDKIGIDQVFLVNFNSIKILTPENFIKDFLIEKLHVSGVFVGFDYKFGKLATGNAQTLREFRDSGQIQLWVEDPIYYKDVTISSTYIKELIELNQLKLAEELLGRPYFMEGIVVQGKKLGSKLGFPTANIKLLANYVLPSEGVYDSEIIVKGKTYKAATSLGKNITLNETEIKIEAHIIDFDEQIYGEEIEIRFITKLREMVKFDNLLELKNQVISDVEKMRNM